MSEPQIEPEAAAVAEPMTPGEVMPESSRDTESAPRAALRRRLAVLEARGARVFDGPAVGLIESLIDGAAEHEGRARELMEARAAARTDALASRFESEYERAADVHRRLAESGRDTDGRFAEALEEGDLVSVLRAGRRLAADVEHAPGSVPERSAEASGVVPATAERGYREALADLMASLSAAAVADSPPEQAGLLNGRLLAARILEAADALSPAYRRVLVGRLIDLGALLHLASVPSPRKRV